MNLIEENEIIKPIMIASIKIEAIAYRYCLHPLGLSWPAVQIMKIMEMLKEVKPSDICHAIGSSKSNVTQRLQWLEKQGLIEKSVCTKGDKRQVAICLSEEGKKKLKALNKTLKDSEVHLEKFFTKEELSNHITFFNKFMSMLDQWEKCEKYH